MAFMASSTLLGRPFLLRQGVGLAQKRYLKQLREPSASIHYPGVKAGSGPDPAAPRNAGPTRPWAAKVQEGD